MTFVIALAVLSAVALVATLRSLRHDGPSRPPRSHHIDTDFVAPASRARFERAA